ncbi:hypothetical protein BOX15_Mlig019304g3, partial [Macrostomum lignano]
SRRGLSERLSLLARPRAPLRRVALLLEVSGHAALLLPLLAVLFALQAGGPEARLLCLRLFAGQLFDLLLIGCLKAVFRRGRPGRNHAADMTATVAVDHYSFPSGHASKCGMMLCLLHFSACLRLPALLWLLAVPASRVLLGRHFPLDVACGFAIGCLEALLMWPYLPGLELSARLTGLLAAAIGRS